MILHQGGEDNSFVSQKLLENASDIDNRSLKSNKSKPPKSSDEKAHKSNKEDGSKAAKSSKTPNSTKAPISSKAAKSSKTPNSSKAPKSETGKSQKSTKLPTAVPTNSSNAPPTGLTGTQGNDGQLSPSTSTEASFNPTIPPVSPPTVTSNPTISPISAPIVSSSPTVSPLSPPFETTLPTIISVTSPSTSAPTISTATSPPIATTDIDNSEVNIIPSLTPTAPPTAPPTQGPSVLQYGEASDGSVVACDTIGVKFSSFELVYEIEPDIHQLFSLSILVESTSNFLGKQFKESFSDVEDISYASNILTGDVAGTSYQYADSGKIITKDVTYTGAAFFCDNSGVTPSKEKLDNIIKNSFISETSNLEQYREDVTHTVQLGNVAYSKITGSKPKLKTVSWTSQLDTHRSGVIFITFLLFILIC